MDASTPARSVPVIQLSNVSVGSLRDAHLAVMRNVNWTVAPGEFWVIGGMQGTGKTDLLLMLAGLTRLIEGEYRLFDNTTPLFEEDRLQERLRIGLVFENGQLFNHLTIAENVALPLRYHRDLTRAETDAEVRHMLEVTGLSVWADSTPGAIGRNWQKRAGLARALMVHPEVLLLDNPLAGLDLRHRAWWLNFIGALTSGHPWMNHRPVTLIATADDLVPWRKRAGRFAVVRDQQFVTLGAWPDVEAAADERVQELLELGPAGT